MIPILVPEQRWECGNCTATAVTHMVEPHTQMHTCAGLRGLTAPMVPAGIRADVRAIEREDYVGHDIVQTDANGRPVMAVETRYDDGHTDLAVLAPCADATAAGRD